jgi:hypothetical protein
MLALHFCVDSCLGGLQWALRRRCVLRMGWRQQRTPSPGFIRGGKAQINLSGAPGLDVAGHIYDLLGRCVPAAAYLYYSQRIGAAVQDKPQGVATRVVGTRRHLRK